MKTYELTYLISQELNQSKITELTTKIESLLKEQGGILLEAKENQKINLGYEIQKQQKAFIGVLKFQLEPEKIKPLKIEFGKIPEILRFMVQTHTIKKKVPTIPKRVAKKMPKEKKVELEHIEKKIEELLG